MIYQVRHQTTYTYSDPVSLSHHLLRLAPRPLPRQRCLQHELDVHPSPTTQSRYTEYFGNELVFLTVEEQHQEFRVLSTATVEVLPAAPIDPGKSPPWESVRDLYRGDGIAPPSEISEFTFPSPHVQPSADLAAYALPSFTPGRPLLEAALDLTQRIHRDFKFDPKATTVSTPLTEVLKLRSGVCQDFAHLEIGCLRSLGLPARYLSGYLETIPPPGTPKLAGADASHAWISLYCPAHGWTDFDPTNDLIPSERHITLGWGRDFGDISPIRGVILGAGDHDLNVEVDVIPVASP
jgi:transglutaminase-like putative cysteine protease